MSNTKDVLQEVHTLLADYFKESLTLAIKDGIEIPASTLGVVVSFLKNNEITADVRDKDGLEDLKERLINRKADAKDKGKDLIEIAEHVGSVMDFDSEIVM